MDPEEKKVEREYEKNFETMLTETQKHSMNMIPLNSKLTYDSILYGILAAQTRSQNFFDHIMADVTTHAKTLNTMLARQFNNSVTSDKRMDGQSTRITDLYTDTQQDNVEKAVASSELVKAGKIDDIARQIVTLGQAVNSLAVELQGILGRPVNNPTGTDPK